VVGNVRKPNGDIYRNTDEDWQWLSTVAGKAARWLGYIPFECISLRPRPSSPSASMSRFRMQHNHDQGRAAVMWAVFGGKGD
jgi:hypothetical protein